MQLIIIASIHQPSTATFQLFDKLLLLSGGQTCYFGPVANIEGYFGNIGFEIPAYTNPAEHLLDLVSADFHGDSRETSQIQQAWSQAANNESTLSQINESTHTSDQEQQRRVLSPEELVSRRPGLISITLSLLHRSLIKSYRDVVAYGIRILMYMGLAIMMGTVWLRLSTSQESIQPFVNAIVRLLYPSFNTIYLGTDISGLDIVLRLSFHVLHGSSLCSSISRRSSNLYQRAREWAVWRDSIHHRQLSDRTALFM